MNLIYSESLLYDLAFSYRDYPQEAATLAHWFKQLNNRPPASALELACGPARHLHELAPTCRTTGVDLSVGMCKYATLIATEAKHQIDFYQLDMATFRLNQKFDLILLLINSVNHLQTTEDLQAMFARVNEHLSDDGLFIIESSVTEPFSTGSSEWTQENETNSVSIKWSWTQHTEHVELNGHIGEKEGAGRRVAMKQNFPMHHWLANELIQTGHSQQLHLLGYSNVDEKRHAVLTSDAQPLENSTSMHSCFVFGPKCSTD